MSSCCARHGSTEYCTVHVTQAIFRALARLQEKVIRQFKAGSKKLKSHVHNYQISDLRTYENPLGFLIRFIRLRIIILGFFVPKEPSCPLYFPHSRWQRYASLDILLKTPQSLLTKSSPELVAVAAELFQSNWRGGYIR